MNRRRFIIQNSILTAGFPFRKLLLFDEETETGSDLYSIFKNPPIQYRPFVRWWWNGDKVEQNELARELNLLKQVGIGGVEINPIKFPARTNDMGKPSLQWLSHEWIDMLQFSLDRARSLDMTCDLIVGSGWPFGAEWLQGDERAQAVVIANKKIEGPADFEISVSDLIKEADPSISSPFAERTMEVISVHLAPSIITKIDDVKNLSDQIQNGKIKASISQGRYVLYAVVKINGFMSVIQGAPGANGPVLNHYNQEAVKKYLNKMSDTIQQQIGPLSNKIRSLFTDSLELEGANWCGDMASEFQKRRGYDLIPLLPFILFKSVAMGNTVYRTSTQVNAKDPELQETVWNYENGSEYAGEFKDRVERARYDFELTKTELITERFLRTFLNWCKANKVKSRVQAYGRGYFPLEGTFDVDIPEGETWIRPGLGTNMSETDYRVGRAFTVMNKFVSSAAHLKNKTLISCEELTNIHLVFNESLDLMKIAGDMSIISGITHPIFHGFNYSPADAPFPGWVIYGTFINERNPWWPYFRLFTNYKARLSALLQQATMFADIAILPAVSDLWSKYGAQNDPFPTVAYPEWQTLVWESIHQNGNACDYVSEKVIRDSAIQNGFLIYGQRKYHSLFLPRIESMDPHTAKKLFDFVKSGGRIFFIETFPLKAPGWSNHEERDKQVQDWMAKIKSFADRCFLVNRPGKNHTEWFKGIQEKYKIVPYVKIDLPNKFVSQVRYQNTNAEILVITNSSINDSFEINIAPTSAINAGKQAWIWDPEKGERYRLAAGNKGYSLDLAPADLKLIIFDKNKTGPIYQSPKKSNENILEIKSPWSIRGEHINGTIITAELSELRDLKDIPEWANFCGTIIYQNHLPHDDKNKKSWMNLGKVCGVSEVSINGSPAGVKWYGRRIFNIGKLLKNGDNTIEIKIVTTMGNYMKSLKDNPVAQFWTNEGRTIQPLQTTGLIGPVTIY